MFMKKIAFIAITLAICYELSGQYFPDDSALIKNYRLNFPVPDQPAFKIFEGIPSNILRPSSVTDLSIITSSFVQGGSLVLPETFALEIAPLLLAKSNNVTLTEWQKNKVLNSLRLSVGSQKTNFNGVTGYNLAFGTRITLVDKGDIKTDISFQDSIFDITAEKTRLENNYKLEYLETNNINAITLALDTVHARKAEIYIQTKLDEHFGNDYFENRLIALKEKYRTENWNKEKLDLAMAVLTNSADSLVNNIHFSTLGFWCTWALPIKKWGQAIIGAHYSYEKLDSLVEDEISTFDKQKLSLAGRVYFGTNKIKGFIEGQLYWQNLSAKQNALINLGSEFGLFDGIWITFNAGYNFFNIFMDNYESSIYATFDLRIQLPEKFKLF